MGYGTFSIDISMDRVYTLSISPNTAFTHKMVSNHKTRMSTDSKMDDTDNGTAPNQISNESKVKKANDSVNETVSNESTEIKVDDDTKGTNSTFTMIPFAV